MRITSEVMVSRSLERLQTRLQAYERTQSQLATGKRILKPSDDPAGARRAIGLQQAMRAREQDLKNISDGLGWLNSADSQLQAASDRLSRIRALTVSAATLTGQGERTAILVRSSEIRNLARPEEPVHAFPDVGFGMYKSLHRAYRELSENERRSVCNDEAIQVDTFCRLLSNAAGADLYDHFARWA
jgi:hypothetical protein